MNSKRETNQALVQVLLGCILCIFLTGLFYFITFKRPSVLGLGSLTRANSTRTAVALTSRALYGPFPTVVGPTPTPSKTRTVTPTPTVTASNTATPTAIHYYIDTVTPRTPIAQSGATSVLGSTEPPPSTQPVVQPTLPPAQPTQPPPAQPTQPPPAQSTKKACVNPQGHPIPCH